MEPTLNGRALAITFGALLLTAGPAWAQRERSRVQPTTWNLGTLEGGRTYPTTITFSNASCAGNQTLVAVVENAPWLRLSQTRVESVAAGESRTVDAVVDLRGVEEGEYRGRVLVRCPTCPVAVCTQDISEFTVLLTVRSAPQVTARGSAPTGCEPICTGNAKPPLLRMDTTETLFYTAGSEPSFTKADLVAADAAANLRLAGVVKNLNSAANCGAWAGGQTEVPIYPGNAVSACASASCTSAGYGAAEVAVIPKGMQLIQTSKPGQADVGAPLKTEIEDGTWRTSLTCPEECEDVETHILMIGAGQGETSLLEHLGKGERWSIRLLYSLIDDIVDALPVSEKAAERIKKAAKRFKFTARLDATSETRLIMNANSLQKIEGTASASLDYERDENGKLTKYTSSRQGFCEVRYGISKSRKVDITVDTTTAAEVLAQGVRIEAVAASSNFWGVIAVMRCGPRIKRVLAYDGQFLEFEDEYGKLQLPRMEAFATMFNAMGGHIDRVTGGDDWKEAFRVEDARGAETAGRLLEGLYTQELKRICEERRDEFKRQSVK